MDVNPEQEAQMATYRAPEYNVPPSRESTRAAVFVYW